VSPSETFQLELLRYWEGELAKPRHADPKRLLRYGFKVYSQCEEDGIIQEIFKRIGFGNRSSFSSRAGTDCGLRAGGALLEKFEPITGHS
jgi:hypothetical protein